MRKIFGRYRHILLQAGLISFFINVLSLAPTIYTLQVFDRVFISRSNETLSWLTFITLLMLFIYLVTDWIRSRLLASVSMFIDRQFGQPVMTAILEDAANPDRGKLSFLARDAGILRNFLGGPGILAVLDAPWLPAFILMIFLFHWVLGCLALLSAASLVFLAILNFRLTQPAQEEIQEQNRQASRFIDLGSRNSEVIKAMGMGSNVVSKWNAYNRAALELQNKLSCRTAWLSASTKFARQAIQIVMLATGAYLVIDQHVTPGVMIAVTLILARALAPIEQLIAHWKTIGGAKAAYARLETALREVSKKPNHLPLPKLQGEVSCEQVSFGVSAGSPPILKGITFSIPPGEFLGVIGPSGSGKSTLIRILIGIWKAQSGKVRIDRADIEHWDAEILGSQIGYLPQDIELFPGSIAENIARLEEINHEAVIDAARLAGAHELILGLPDGYATDIGRTGDSLSGGQRQRIALARALYRTPQLVVLDEPNANLDADGELALFEALTRLKGAGTTVVMICHKPSLLAHADKLLVLRDGAVLAIGPREEILTKLAPVKCIHSGEQRERA